MCSSGTPRETMILNGIKLYQIRRENNLTQTQLANKIGVTFQQIQKYEKGRNGLSGHKMFKLSKIFNKPMEYFFEPLKEISCDEQIHE